MLVHPQFDPIAFQIGPLAVRWYGLMYLIGFVLFVVLGSSASRQNLLTGWHPRDIDDMLFYGVLGVILGGRLGYVLFYKPRTTSRIRSRCFASGRAAWLSTAAFSACSSRCGCSRAGASKRWLDVTDFVAPLVPLGLAAGRLGNFINGELWGRVTRRALGDGVPAGAVPSRGIRRSSTSSGSRACCCSRAVALHAKPRGRAARRRGCSSSATACAVSSPSSRASPTASSGCSRSASRWGSGCRCR